MIGKTPRYRLLAVRVTEAEYNAIKTQAAGQTTDAYLYRRLFGKNKD